MNKKKKHTYTSIYTDGSYYSDTDKGGYAAYIDKEEKVVFGNNTNTSNNQMELTAVIEALKHTKDTRVEIFSDSQYVTNAFNKDWLDSWKNNDWENNKGEIKNKSLWQQLDEEVNKKKDVKFTWVKGHSDNEHNNLCDAIAKAATNIKHKV